MNQALNALAQAALNEELAQYVAQLRAGNHIDTEEPIDHAVAAHAVGMADTPATHAAQLLIAAGVAMLREAQLAQIAGISCQWHEMLEEFDVVVTREHRWAITKLRAAMEDDFKVEANVAKWHAQTNIQPQE